MATTQEKQELIDKLSAPRYYRITINGYGGESAYSSLSDDAYNFWRDHTEQYGDTDLITYILCAEDEQFDFEELEAVPRDADFMIDEDGDARPWYEPPNEIEHVHGVNYASAWLNIEEVAVSDEKVTPVADIVDRQDLVEYCDRVESDADEAIELVKMSCCKTPDDAKYIAHMYSIEKGCFFDAIVETHGDFDPAKLKFYTTEFLNREDTLTEVHYDGVELENDGGDTNGKGYLAAVFEY